MPSGMPPQADGGIRRKMRKGTHSCFECRRRKIRCIFPPDNPSVCSECFARGSRCIDQEHVDVDVQSLDQRKNLRERVARLEGLIDALLDDRSASQGKISIPADLQSLIGSKASMSVSRTSASPSATSDADAGAGGESPEAGGYHHESAPLLTLFNNSVLRTATNESVEEGSTVELVDRRRPSDQKVLAKNQRVANELRTHLPKPADLEAYVQKHGAAYAVWHRMYLFSDSLPDDAFAQLARQAQTSDQPALVARFLLAIASNINTGEYDKFVPIVERLVLNDDDYACSVIGLECFIMAGGCYFNLGRPRKAWRLYRRAISCAQLIGLHRNHSQSSFHEHVWWSLYEGDRYLSVSLGLPYALYDAHCDLDLETERSFARRPQHVCRARLAVLTGKVIDRIQGSGDQSLSSAMAIDQAIDDLVSNMTKVLSTQPSSERYYIQDEFERLMLTMMSNQIRVTLHLPFLLGSANNPRYEYSKAACFQGARESLGAYFRLSEIKDRSGYTCRMMDFVGFMGGIVLLLGLLGYGRLSGGSHDLLQESEDRRMIFRAMDVLQTKSFGEGGMVAAQSYNTLKTLAGALDGGCEDCEGESVTVCIPYFGTLSITPGSQFKSPQPSAGAGGMGNHASPSTSSVTTNGGPGLNSTGAQSSATCSTLPTPQLENLSYPTQPGDPFVAYNGFYMPSFSSSSMMHPSSTSTSSHPTNPQSQNNQQSQQQNITDPTAFANDISSIWGTTDTGFLDMGSGMGGGWNWPNPNMEIDQDWSMFLNSDPVWPAQAGQGVMVGGQGQGGGSGQGQGQQGVMFGKGMEWKVEG